MPSRSADVVKKGWNYMLDILEQPGDVPLLTYSVFARSAHLGELLKLRRVQRWLTKSGVNVVIDVGANSGQFASAVRSLFPDVYIYSFEPLPEPFERLKSKLERHGNFEPFCLALGDKPGEVTFWKSSLTKSSSVLRMTSLHKEAFPWTSDNRSITVKMESLDNLAGQLRLRPRTLMKIDVQGYEMNVLKGAVNVLKQIDYLWIETSFQPLYDGQANFDELYSFLKARGFEYAGSPEQLHSPLDGCILQEDVLFVQKR